jgi:Tol biopolymer transport system component
MNVSPQKNNNPLGGMVFPALFLTWLILFIPLKSFRITPVSEETEFRSGVDRPVSGIIVWSTSRHHTWEIYKMKADGSGKVRLTQDQHNNQHPVWSQSGEWIYYQRNDDIFRMHSDGSNAQLVVKNGFSFDLVDDSSKLVYVVQEKFGNSIRLYDIQTQRSEEIIPSRVPELRNKEIRFPTLSPDGEWLSFSSAYPQAWSVHIMNLDKNITSVYARGCMPQYSPDGMHIAWVFSGTHDIYIGTPHRNQKRALKISIPGRPHRYFPKWSEDGNHMVFAASPSPNRQKSDYEIFITPLKGGQAVRLTFHPATDTWPDIF